MAGGGMSQSPYYVVSLNDKQAINTQIKGQAALLYGY